MTDSNGDVLLRRSPDQDSATFEINGVGVPLTAWAMLDGQIDLLELVDGPETLARVRALMSKQSTVRIVTAEGGVREVEHIPDAAAGWSIGRRNQSGQAVGYYHSAPIGRSVMDAEVALPGAELAGTLERAIQPLSVLTGGEPRTLLMVAGPQSVAADDDERALARMLAGLLRDCHQLPLPLSPALELELWRRLTTSPEAQGRTAPRRPHRGGVVDMQGNVVAGGEGEASERDQEGRTVRVAAGAGVRVWRVSLYVRDEVERLLPDILSDETLRARVRVEVLPGCDDAACRVEDCEHGDA